MAEIVKIKKDGVIQYPITKPECVIDENGKNVLQLIKENGGGSSYDYTEVKEELARLEREKADKSELTELSEEVSELSEKIDNLPSASNEWKCVYDGRLEVGADEWVFSTYADGTPLKAEEVVVQVIMDNDTTKTTQAYVRVQSSTNKSETFYGAFFVENPNNSGFIAMSQVRLKASPFIMVAEMYDNLPLKVAQGVNCVGRLGKDVYQIYEDITLVRISTTTKIAEAAPLLKIYAR